MFGLRGGALSGALAFVVACGPKTGGDEGGEAGSGSEGTSSGVTAASTSSSGETSASSAMSSGSSTTGPGSACEDHGFPESVAAWEAEKGANGDTYYMVVVRQDSGPFGEPLDSGCRYTHTLQIRDGKPAERYMFTEVFGGHDISMCEPSWDESGPDLGTHPGALQPWTMEQHYEACCDGVLTLPETEYDVTFGTFANGILRHCSAWPLNCLDGCSEGPDGYPGGIDFDEVGFGLAP